MIRSRLRVALVAVALTAAVAQVEATPAEAGATGTKHVIVRSTGADTAAALVARAGGHVDRTLGLIHAVAATVPTAALPALRAEAEVTDDAPVHLANWKTSPDYYAASADDDSMYSIENIIGARSVWKAGYTGRGVDVALVDSGVAPVPGILGSNVVQGPDLTEESQDPATDGVDTFGHGTHLAGIIAGHDADVNNATGAWHDRTDFLGVAPD